MLTSEKLFKLLSRELSKNIAGLVVTHDNKWSSFSQKGAPKFAYIQLAKRTAKLSIWCKGSSNEIKSKYNGKINFLPRSESSGEFGKNYQISFMVENDNDIKEVIPLLIEISSSWSEEELLASYNFYCKMPLQNINVKNKEIITFAEIINKTPKEIVKRFNNFSRLDAAVKIIDNIDSQDIRTQDLFHSNWEKTVNKSERLLFDFENNALLDKNNFPQGKEKESIIKTRVNQNFFRQVVLASYQNKCCITGITVVELLNASHIVPWSVDSTNRLNPRNGLSLNALHDRAFDRGFITITTGYTIKVSKCILNLLDNNFANKSFFAFQNEKITLPQRFAPDKDFLQYHNKEIFKN